jgi:hypothetical protein
MSEIIRSRLVKFSIKFVFLFYLKYFACNFHLKKQATKSCCFSEGSNCTMYLYPSNGRCNCTPVTVRCNCTPVTVGQNQRDIPIRHPSPVVRCILKKYCFLLPVSLPLGIQNYVPAIKCMHCRNAMLIG